MSRKHKIHAVLTLQVFGVGSMPITLMVPQVIFPDYDIHRITEAMIAKLREKLPPTKPALPPHVRD